MKINASCTVDLDSVKALTRLMMFRKHDPQKRMIAWGLIYAVLIIVVVLEFVAWGPNNKLILMLCILVLVQILMCYWYFLMPILQYKAMSKLKNAVNHYCFLDDVLEIISSGDCFDGRVELQYSVIVKSMETSKYFFIFQTNNQVYIVDKTTITGGTAEDIRNKLVSYVGKKHLVCKY